MQGRRVTYKPLLGFMRVPKPAKSIGSTLLNPDYEQEMIDEAVKEMEADEKEKKLLDLVIKSPESDEKTEILKNKFKIKNTRGQVDAYAESDENLNERIASGILYRYDCYFPVDKRIDGALRPTDYMKKLGPFENETEPRDQFYFYFPTSRVPHDDEIYFKIDFMNIYLYEDGNIRPDLSTPNTIYSFLEEMSLAKGVAVKKEIKNKYINLLRGLGMIQTVGRSNVLTYVIKGIGITVDKKIIKNKKSAMDPDPVVDPKPEIDLDILKADFLNYLKDTGLDTPKESRDAADMLIAYVRKSLKIGSGDSIEFLFFENFDNDALLLPMVVRKDGNKWKIGIINTKFVGSNPAKMKEHVDKYNKSILEDKEIKIGVNFKKKLNEINKTLVGDDNKIKTE